MTRYFIKPKSWIELNSSDVIQKISTNKKKVKQKEYLESGSLPIIDQGSKYIGGYTNDFSKKIDCELPVIVFGDHTKIIKFINFDFAPGADGVKVIKPRSCYEPKLFQFFLKVLVNKIPDKGYARHFQHIEKTKIPLRPLPEQRAIVEKIEELFSELDNGIENLKKAREQLKTYRQAVLKYAFEGKLTEEWRTRQVQGGTPPEPAEKLLEQIKTEQEKYYQKQLEDWKKTCELAEADGKKKPAKPKKPNELPPLAEKKQAEFPELPDGWGWVRTEHIADIETGTTPSKKSPKNYGNNYPFYKPTDLNAGSNVRKSHDNLSEVGYLKARVVPINSILVTCIGATIGKTGIIRKEGAFNQQINAIIPFDNIVPDYVYYQAICPFLQNQIVHKASSTTLPI